MTPDDAKAPPDGTPKPPDAKTSPFWRSPRFLLGLSSLAVLFILSGAGSWGYRLLSKPHDDPDKHVAETPKDPAKKAENGGTRAALLARGDRALLHHRYTEALLSYDEILEGGAGEEATPINYRHALCNEALGHLDQAIGSYRKTITGATSPNLNLASHLALARCLLRRNHPVEARRLLYPFLLDTARLDGVPESFVSDARFLVALSLARDATPPKAGRLDPDELASFAASALEISFYLDEIAATPEPPAASKDEKEEPAPGPLVVQKATDKTPAIVVHVKGMEQPAWKLLDQIAAAGGLRTEWSADAKRMLEDRPLRLQLRDRTLQNLLCEAADHLDLVCLFDKDAVHFSTPAETDAKKLVIHRREMAQRALHNAYLADGSHIWAPAAQLELGNAALADEKWDDAKNWYESVALEAPSSRFVAPACFNLAQAYLRQQQYRRARKAFFRVVDHAPGHELALRAYLKIGQLYLDEEDSKEAVVHLRRAQSMAPLSPFHPLVTLTLAAGYVHQGELDKARSSLTQYRAVLQKEPYKATAAFLDTFAQYRRAKTVSSVGDNKREASDLIATLWRDQDDTLLGTYGLWLLAEAYRDMGFPAHAERLLRKALTQAQGPFVACLEFTLADTLARPEPSEEAIALFNKLAAADTPYRPKARFQLARLALQAQRHEECVARCQQLWSEKTFTDSPALLHVWGSALEGVGELAKAAQCFAGKAPE